MSDYDDLAPTSSDDSWLDEQNEEALRSREEADFHHGDPRFADQGEEEKGDLTEG